MINTLLRIYRGAVDWVERGDLVPLLILVAVPHYITVMRTFEFWPVAVAMGILTDLGHYRTILVYLRSSVGRFASVFWMLILTAMSYAFHVGFYTIGNTAPQPWPWALGAVPPVLIFAMSYISKREGWQRRKSAEPTVSSTAVKYDYRHLSDADKQELRGLSVSQIMSRYPSLSERTARNWKHQGG